MRRFLALSVTAYWTVFFGLLALAAIGEATGTVLFGGARIAAALWPTPGLGDAGSSAGLAIGHALAAALFAWTFVSTVADPADGSGDAIDVAGIAFGLAIGVMGIVLVLAVLHDERDLFASASVQFVALLVSYVAIRLERTSAAMPRAQDDPDRISPARLMALGAAHSSLLPRLTRRPDADAGKGA